MNDLDQLWRIQKDQQSLWHDLDGLSAAERELLVKDLLLHMHEEVAELQRLMDRSRYHLIKRVSRPPAGALAEAGVDVAKLLVALMIIGGISPQQFLDEFIHKTAVVKSKWQWEQDAMSDVEVLFSDIDGCIAQWHLAFQIFARGRGTVIAPGKLNAPELEPLKEAFNAEGGFLGLAPYDDAIRVLNDWRSVPDRNRRLILVTARPFRRHRRIHTDTLAWCEAMGLLQDHVLFEQDKAEAVRSVQPARIIAHIEDRGKHALEVAGTGVKVLKLPHEAEEEQIIHPNVITVHGWAEIEAHLKGLS